MRVLVLGAGISGRAAVRLALRVGDSVTLVDPEGDYEDGDDVEVASELTPELLEDCDVVVTSPGIPEHDPKIRMVKRSGRPLWSEIEYAFGHLEIPLVAITGTNGKTTVTNTTTKMLTRSGVEAVAAGNVGNPLADVVGSKATVAVVEVSSFQLANTHTFHPVASAVLNVAPDHLDWHRDQRSYAAAKAKVFANQSAAEVCVFDADDSGAVHLVRSAPARTVPVSGRSRPAGGWGVEGAKLVAPGVDVPLAEIPRSDAPTLANLTTSAVLAHEVGADADATAGVIRDFHPDPHRRILVTETDGVRWVDDSKATNPHAALASISAEGSVVLIAGGLAKGLDVRPLATAPGVRYVVGIGTAGPDLVAAAVAGEVAEDMGEAVRIAATRAQSGDTVLLAPGCASFDQFESYAHRGERFTEEVELLVARTKETSREK